MKSPAVASKPSSPLLGQISSLGGEREVRKGQDHDDDAHADHDDHDDHDDPDDHDDHDESYLEIKVIQWKELILS